MSISSFLFKNQPRVIARIVGGLGNQLFIYATARRLALKNDVPVVLDTSYYQYDFFKRQYCLHHFNIQAQPADSVVLSPVWRSGKKIWRIIRRLLKERARLQKFANRSYLFEEYPKFDERILHFQVTKQTYLDGLWQTEKYFKDIKGVIRKDFQIVTRHDEDNVKMAKNIKSSNAVCLHVRRLHGLPYSKDQIPDSSVKIPSIHKPLYLDYYSDAIERILRNVAKPVFYCFGDYPQWIFDNLDIDCDKVVITNNPGDEKNYEDFWLMSLCKHFVISNSSFSWWAAWLSESPGKIVVAPKHASGSYYEDFFPDAWLLL